MEILFGHHILKQASILSKIFKEEQRDLSQKSIIVVMKRVLSFLIS